MFQQILLTALSFVALTGMNAAPYMAEHPLTTIAIRAEKRSTRRSISTSITPKTTSPMAAMARWTSSTNSRSTFWTTDNVTINVSYSTFSTMEDELSKLQTGGTSPTSSA
jgi:hypothetical protein